jgi:hypothetical protein
MPRPGRGDSGGIARRQGGVDESSISRRDPVGHFSSQPFGRWTSRDHGRGGHEGIRF